MGVCLLAHQQKSEIKSSAWDIQCVCLCVHGLLNFKVPDNESSVILSHALRPQASQDPSAS